VDVSLIVKLFKTNRQKYPSVSPPSHRSGHRIFDRIRPKTHARPMWVWEFRSELRIPSGSESSSWNPLSAGVGLRDSAGSHIRLNPTLGQISLDPTETQRSSHIPRSSRSLFPGRSLWEIWPNPTLCRISYPARSSGVLAADDWGQGFSDVAGGPAVRRAGFFQWWERDLDQHFS
jgi:hypothetical protein